MLMEGWRERDNIEGLNMQDHHRQNPELSIALKTNIFDLTEIKS